jgi:hypothetical protein
MLLISGGGYQSCCDGVWIDWVAKKFREPGFVCVSLTYRTPSSLGGLARHTTAWQDLQRAVWIVRGRAAAKGLDPDRIGIMGSSAGGHLTLIGATSSKRRSYGPIDDLDALSCRVQRVVAIYSRTRSRTARINRTPRAATKTTRGSSPSSRSTWRRARSCSSTATRTVGRR